MANTNYVFLLYFFLATSSSTPTYVIASILNVWQTASLRKMPKPRLGYVISCPCHAAWLKGSEGISAHRNKITRKKYSCIFQSFLAVLLTFSLVCSSLGGQFFCALLVTTIKVWEYVFCLLSRLETRIIY